MNDAVLAQLLSKGFTSESAQSKAKLVQNCAEALGSLDGAKAWFVPGRVEILGKHTDYCGGRSVVAAVDQGIIILSRPRKDSKVAINNVGTGKSCEFDISADLEPPIGPWTNYPMTTARRIARDFPGPHFGADIAMSSDLTAASGMSSSSALIIASFFALADANRLEETELYQKELGLDTQLASYVAAIEGGKGYGPFRADHGVGTAGGSEDHTAILCSVPGKLGVYSYRPVRLERHVDFPKDYVLVICSSGVVAEKTGAAMELYNRASRLASEGSKLAAEALRSQADDFATLSRGYSEDDIVRSLKGEDYANRYRHFNAESNIIIPDAVEALATVNLKGWSEAVLCSQRTGERLLRNQVSETVFLAESAYETGALASSAFGAGFGGSVWAMVRDTESGSFAARWQDAYLAKFPQYDHSAQWFETRPGPAAFSIELPK